MRLRERVNQFTFDSSSEDDAGDAQDEDFQPEDDDDEGAGAADISLQRPAVAVQRPAPPVAPPVLRNLTPVELSRALLDAQVVHTEPLRLPVTELTPEWLRSGAFRAPVVVACTPGSGVAEELGMTCPAEFTQTDSPTELAASLLRALGPDVPVPNFDVETQTEQTPVPLSAFVDYFTKTRRDKLLNVVSLSLANTPLESAVTAPQLVRDTDLVASCWPPEVVPKPEVQLYALCSPGGCYTDWHLDFGGSSVWYRIIAGSKVFMAAPPTEHNIRQFVRWASSSRQSREFLGNVLEQTHRYTVRAGDLLLIPGGWPHAVFTPSDSFVVGGNFLHSANLQTQCLVWRIEDRLGIKPSFRYPSYKALCWYAAHWMCRRLPPAPGEDLQAAKDAARMYATRLSVKLQTNDGGEGDERTRDDADKAHDEAGLQFILHALGSDGNGDKAVVDGAHVLDEAPADPTDDASTPGDGGKAAPRPLAPAADLTPTGPPLTEAELIEVSSLYAQLKLWLAQAKNNERDAGAPFGMLVPRLMLTRLKLRLRAAGQTMQLIEDAFDEPAAPRVRVRQREPNQFDDGLPLVELPSELGDEVDDDSTRKKVVKTTDKGAEGKPAACKQRAPAHDVRSRLASKLKMSTKKAPIRR